MIPLPDSSPRCALGIRDHHVGHPRCQPLGQFIPGLGRAIPFLAIPLQAVHIKSDGHAENARHPGEYRVGGVAIQHGILPSS